MAEEKGNEIGLGLVGFPCRVGVLGMETSDDSKGSKFFSEELRSITRGKCLWDKEEIKSLIRSWSWRVQERRAWVMSWGSSVVHKNCGGRA